MLSTKPVLWLSLMASVLLFSACQPKPDPEDAAASSATAASAAQTAANLTGKIERLPLQLPPCKGKNCPEFSVERLSSNYAFIDAALDQAIVSHLADMLDIAEPKIKASQAQAAKAAQAVKDQNQRKNNDPAQSNTSTDSAAEASSAIALPNPQQQLVLKVQPYLDGFLTIDQEMKSLGAAHQISLMMKPAILQAQGRIVTVVLNSSSYLGGAHGAASQRYYNFDLKVQQPLVLNDIVEAKQKPALTAKAHEVFAAWVLDNKLAANLADYEQAWPFSLSDNFYLSPQGLILQYGEYDIGPYVVGLPRLVIPYNQLQGIIKPQYLPTATAASPAMTLKN